MENGASGGEGAFAEILACLRFRVDSGLPALVGIDGGAGAGKTTFSELLLAEWRKTAASAAIVHVDHFYPCAAVRTRVFPTVFDCEWKRLRDEVLAPLRGGKPAVFRPYDWAADRLQSPQAIAAGSPLVVEGVGALRAELAGYFDLRIWLSCPLTQRELRMLGRGDFSAEEVRHWLPAETRFFRDHQPETRAHLVLDTAGGQGNGPEGRWRTVRWSPPGEW